MKLIVLIHEAEEGGYWAEVPVLGGCVSFGDTMAETLANIEDAAVGVWETMLDRVKEGTALGFPSIPDGFSWEGTEEEMAIAWDAAYMNYARIREALDAQGSSLPVTKSLKREAVLV